MLRATSHTTSRWTFCGVAAAAALVLASCSASIHGPHDPVDEDLRPEQIERALTREARPASNLRVVATLWDPALIEADDRPRRKAEAQAAVYEPTQQIEARHSRWTERYVHAGTTFTVVVELANRPRLRRGDEDLLVDPESWTFSLDRGEQRTLTPRKVAVQAIDRFPSRAGGYHYRIAFAVTFPGPLHGGLSGVEPSRLRLYVRPSEHTPRRAGYGRVASRRGFQLTWHVEPAAGTDSFPVAARR